MHRRTVRCADAFLCHLRDGAASASAADCFSGAGRRFQPVGLPHGPHVQFVSLLRRASLFALCSLQFFLRAPFLPCYLSAPDHPLVWCGQPAPPLLLAHVCFSRRERCCALPPPLTPSSFLSLPPHLVVHASSAAVPYGHWQRGRRVRPHRDVREGGARGNESSVSFSFWCSAQPPAGLLMRTRDERRNFPLARALPCSHC